MAPLEEAEKAISILREGIKAVLDLVGLDHPPWISDDSDRGWKGPNTGSRAFARGCSHIDGVQEDDPDAVRITYVQDGGEWTSVVAPPGTPHIPFMDNPLASLIKPAEAIRAYRGGRLLDEWRPDMR